MATATSPPHGKACCPSRPSTVRPWSDRNKPAGRNSRYMTAITPATASARMVQILQLPAADRLEGEPSSSRLPTIRIMPTEVTPQIGIRATYNGRLRRVTVTPLPVIYSPSVPENQHTEYAHTLVCGRHGRLQQLAVDQRCTNSVHNLVERQARSESSLACGFEQTVR